MMMMMTLGFSETFLNIKNRNGEVSWIFYQDLCKNLKINKPLFFVNNFISITTLICSNLKAFLIMEANEMHYFSNLFEK